MSTTKVTYYRIGTQFCKKCRSVLKSQGSVGPYTKYKCTRCGNREKIARPMKPIKKG